MMTRVLHVDLQQIKHRKDLVYAELDKIAKNIVELRRVVVEKVLA